MATSTIKTLPADLLELLQAWLRDPKITQEEATNRLNDLLLEIGEKKRSKSAVNRYSVQMSEVGKKLQQSREIADMWIGKLGNAPQGKVGQITNEVVRTLVFDTAIELADSEGMVDPKVLKDLAMAIEKLENATTINEKRKSEIEKAVLTKAVKEADKVMAEAGLSEDTADQIRQRILGM